MAVVTPTATANPTPRLPHPVTRPAKPAHAVGGVPPHAARRASACLGRRVRRPVNQPHAGTDPGAVFFFLSRAARRLRRRHRERGWCRPRLALFPMASRSGSADPITAAYCVSRAPASAPPVLLRAEARARQVYFILEIVFSFLENLPFVIP